jgi:threonine synthase
VGFVEALSCRRCGAEHPQEAYVGCTACGAPLDPRYDWDALAGAVTRQDVAIRPRTIWRYRELLPLDGPPSVSLHVGWTPLVEVPQLADLLGVGRLWVKVEGVSFPSLSFKDRVVAVAVNKAVELGIRTVGCPSTGNLANAVAAHAAAAGLDAWVFILDTVGRETVGTLAYWPNVAAGTAATRSTGRREAAVVRSYPTSTCARTTARSKTMATIAEPAGAPTAVVTPWPAAHWSKLAKGFGELMRLGWIGGPVPRVFGGQPAGCAPIVTAVHNGSETITPVRPNTVVRSLSIGDPVDGPWAVRTILETAGWAAAVTDPEMVEGIMMLAEFGGIFAETAGGVTVAAARRLAAEGWLTPDDEVVLCSTGNGLKTVEAIDGALEPGPVIGPSLTELERLL